MPALRGTVGVGLRPPCACSSPNTEDRQVKACRTQPHFTDEDTKAQPGNAKECGQRQGQLNLLQVIQKERPTDPQTRARGHPATRASQVTALSVSLSSSPLSCC